MHVTFSHSSSYAEFSGHAHTAEVSFRNEVGFHEIECKTAEAAKPYLRNMETGEVIDIEGFRVGGYITVPSGTYTIYYGSAGPGIQVPTLKRPLLSSNSKPASPWYRRFAK